MGGDCSRGACPDATAIFLVPPFSQTRRGDMFTREVTLVGGGWQHVEKVWVPCPTLCVGMGIPENMPTQAWDMAPEIEIVCPSSGC